VIGWASCWQGCDDEAHRAVVSFLCSRGARHHIFSAVAMNLEHEVRRIVAADPRTLHQRQSRNESHRTPLHFAVWMNRPQMVALLLELGADPLVVDSAGLPVAAYATTPGVDRHVMEAVRTMTLAELASAERGHRRPGSGAIDLVACLALRDFTTADRLVRENPALIERGRASGGALHLLAKRNDVAAVEWLLDRGADPNAWWAHWDADLTPLHLAAQQGHLEVLHALLVAGGDPSLRDSKHDGDAAGWAEHGRNPPASNWREIVQMIRDHVAKPR